MLRASAFVARDFVRGVAAKGLWPPALSAVGFAGSDGAATGSGGREGGASWAARDSADVGLAGLLAGADGDASRAGGGADTSGTCAGSSIGARGSGVTGSRGDDGSGSAGGVSSIGSGTVVTVELAAGTGIVRGLGGIGAGGVAGGLGVTRGIDGTGATTVAGAGVGATGLGAGPFVA